MTSPTLADKLNQPGKVAGICLRGKTGWGENLAAFDTVVNTFGGQWFDTSWNAKLNSPAFTDAANFYVNLIKKDGEPGAATSSFNECLNTMQQGKAAMWYDATVAASTLDAAPSPVAGQLGFAPAPVDKTKSSGWLWSLGAGRGERIEAQGRGVAVHGLGDVEGLHRLRRAAERLGRRASGDSPVDLRQRRTTSRRPRTSPVSRLQEINSVNVKQPGVDPQPVPGVQYVGIPEFEDFGTTVSGELTKAIAGQESVDSFIANSQKIAQQAVIDAGYKK